MGGRGGIERIKNMKIENPQLINAKKTSPKRNNRMKPSVRSEDLENMDALEIIVNSRLTAVDSRLSKFLSNNPIPDGQEAFLEFERIRQDRFMTEHELMDLIENFGDEGLVKITRTVGRQQRVVEKETMEIAGEKRKDDLKYKIVLFSYLHNLSDDLLKQACGGKKSKNEKGENRKNEHNIKLAEMQQHLAMSIIKNPKENFPLFSEMSARLSKIYNFSDQQSASLEGGVVGLIGAYHHYRKKGYKVLFATPKTDASKQTDLYLVKWGRLISEEKEILTREGIEKIDNLPLDIRNEVSKAQVKCHINKDKPTRDIIFDLATNSAYEKEADLIEGNALYSISDYDYRPDEAYIFFKNQCAGLTNGRFLDIKINDAKSYIEEG